MRSCRVTLTWLVVLAAVLLSIPASAIAGGPSAGDNQYTDPLAGSHNGSGSHTSTGSAPTPAPTPTASSSSGSSTTPLSSASPTSSTASPTATTAATASSSRTLPRTGFDAGLAAAIGVGMIGVGLLTRRRIRCASR